MMKNLFQYESGDILNLDAAAVIRAPQQNRRNHQVCLLSGHTQQVICTGEDWERLSGLCKHRAPEKPEVVEEVVEEPEPQPVGTKGKVRGGTPTKPLRDEIEEKVEEPAGV